MENTEVSTNVILAVIATPMLSALVDVMKRRGPAWMNDGMAPALIAEVIGVLLGIASYATAATLYGNAPTAPLALYLGAGFNVGLAAVGLHAQYKAAQAAPITGNERENP